MYRPQSVVDERITYEEPSRILSPDWLANKLNKLGSGQELAIHSMVKNYNNDILHIPMIDLSSKSISMIKESLGSSTLNDITNEGRLYNSGRSFHFYGNNVISQSYWYKFMGNILLLNSTDRCDISDCRWVGHRLMAGYSSLRWSNNTDNYISYPKFRVVIR